MYVPRLHYVNQFGRDKYISRGKHTNVSVLAREARLLNQLHYPEYAKDDIISRKSTGEADILGGNAGIDYLKKDIYSRPLALKDYINMKKYCSGVSTEEIKPAKDMKSDLPVRIRTDTISFDPARHKYV